MSQKMERISPVVSAFPLARRSFIRWRTLSKEREEVEKGEEKRLTLVIGSQEHVVVDTGGIPRQEMVHIADDVLMAAETALKWEMV